MTARDVVDLYTLLNANDIQVWIDGGWAVDALLGKQLREHKDLDIAIQWKDVPKFRQLLEAKRFQQTKADSQWNFVLADGESQEVDVHAFVFDDNGNVADGIPYPPKSLSGRGIIGGYKVHCIAAPYMVEFMAPWISRWPEKYIPAVEALCEKFRIDLPKEYRAIRS